MKTNEEIDKYLRKNLGEGECENHGNQTYFDNYTGKVRYVVNYEDIKKQYSREDDKDIVLFEPLKNKDKYFDFEFDCEKATFGITECGFIDWKQGVFLGGDFVGDFNGIWKGGNFHYGNFMRGVWENGIWNGNLFQRSIWKTGQWITSDSLFKTYKKSIFMDSIWETGTWKNGGFLNSTWLNGVWENGNFVGSQWVNGIWKGGSFVESVWVDGNWYGGELSESSAWLAGPFSFRDEVKSDGVGKYTLENKPNKFNYDFTGKKNG